MPPDPAAVACHRTKMMTKAADYFGLSNEHCLELRKTTGLGCQMVMITRVPSIQGALESASKDCPHDTSKESFNHLQPIRRNIKTKLYRHRPQIALQEKLDTMARAGDKLARHPTQSREKDGKGKQNLNHLITASASKAGKQRQPRAKSGTETRAAAAKSEIMKGDKLGRQGGSGSQRRNHEGRQAWETRRQRQPRAKS